MKEFQFSVNEWCMEAFGEALTKDPLLRTHSYEVPRLWRSLRDAELVRPMPTQARPREVHVLSHREVGC
jgi:hypothetical protein